jgi:Dolichyl-phosphate-mannose-protein mannosyltransferase
MTVLIILMIVGGALRVHRLGYQSLWNDEIVSWISAQGTPWHIITQRDENSNIPPLYYLVAGASLPLRGRIGVEAALRAPSVLVGVLSIPLLFLVVRTWLDERVALLSAAAMTVSPFHVWYSQEARPYALLLFLSLVALSCLQQALAQPGRWEWKAATALATAATFYCHTVGVAFMAFVVVYVALATRDPAPLAATDGDPRSRQPLPWRARVSGWIVAFVVMGALCLPGIYRLATFPPTESADSGRSLSPIQFGYALWSFAAGYSYGPSLDELHRPDRNALLLHSAATVVPLGIVLLVVTAMGIRSLARRYAWGRLPVALWLVFPVAFAAVGALVTVHPFNVRYTIISFFPALVLIVAGIDALPGKLLRGLAWAGVGAVCAVSLLGYYTDPRYARDDNRGAAAFLLAHGGADAVVVAHRAFTVKDLRFYAPSATHIVPFPRARRPGERLDPMAELAGIVEGQPLVWLFLSRGPPDENAPIIALLEHQFRRTERFMSSGVQLDEYSRDTATRVEPAGARPGEPVAR